MPHTDEIFVDILSDFRAKSVCYLVSNVLRPVALKLLNICFVH